MRKLMRPVFMLAACILLLVTRSAAGEFQDTQFTPEETQTFVKVVEGVYAAFPNPKARHIVTAGFVIGQDWDGCFNARVDTSFLGASIGWVESYLGSEKALPSWPSFCSSWVPPPSYHKIFAGE